MDIKFLGTGGAFDFKYGNSSAIVNFKGKNYLIDCGHDVYRVLREKELTSEIDFILITHFHADHVGSLSTLILHLNHFVKEKQIKILYPEKKFRKDLIKYLTFSLQMPENYVEFISLEAHDKDIGFIDTKDLHVKGLQSYSYYFIEDEHLLAYSGDLGDSEIVFETLKKFDHLKRKTVFHEIFFLPQVPSHTYYKDLEKHMDKYEIYGYHCDPTKNPEDNKIPLVWDYIELRS